MRAARLKLSRISAPVNPVASTVTPGSSVTLAKATTQRRCAAPDPAGTSQPASRSATTTAPLNVRAPRRQQLLDAVDRDEVPREADGLRHGHVEEEGCPLAGGGLGSHQIRAHVL